jgi:hypothetical protein
MSTERLVALCTSAHLRSWIEAEIGDLVTNRFYAPTVTELVAILARGGASSSELMVLDLDVLTAPSTFELKAGLEERWWNGTIVGLGSLRGVHRRYLSIDRTIDRPFGSEALRAYVECAEGVDTQPIVNWPDGYSRKRNGSDGT